MDEREGGDIFFQDFIEEDIAPVRNGVSEIQSLLNGATVFLTGATGLLGQTLIEKLLRSTNVKKIYALIRPTSDLTVNERLHIILSGVLFRMAAKKRLDMYSAVSAIQGDCEISQLGMSDRDVEVLIKEVDVVFHLANNGSRKLRTSVLVNLRATRDILSLAQKMRRVKSIVYVSTVFSTAIGCEGVEKITPPRISYEKLLMLLDILDDENLQLLQKSLTRGWVDTRCFTQHVAEYMIRVYEAGLPIAIFRPAIVISTAFEPLVGWVNGCKGPQCLAYESLSGALKVFHASPHSKADLVPADLTVNALLALAMEISKRRGDGPNVEDLSLLESSYRPGVVVPVVNFTSARSNPITWETFMHFCFTYGVSTPKLSDIFLPHLLMTSNKMVLSVRKWLLHYLPAACMDVMLYLTRQSPRCIAAYRQLHETVNTLAAYTNHSWHFQDNNRKDLWKRMSAKDKIHFNFNVESVDWSDYMKMYIRGLRTYIGKENMSTPAIRKRMTRIRVINTARKITLSACVFMLFVWIYIVIVLKL